MGDFWIGSNTKARQQRLSSLLCLLVLLILSGCGPHENFDTISFSGSTMGTTYNIRVVIAPDREVPPDLHEQIEQWLAEVNQSMSTYIDDSELMELNRAPIGQWLSISDEMAEVLREAENISLLSEGAFDITVGPLVDLWGFGPGDISDEVPTEDMIQAARDHVGFEHLVLRTNPPAIRKDVAVRMDLSAIAKGFGADYVGRRLEALGLENYMVEIGGDLAVRGYNQRGDDWRIGVEKPSFNHNQDVQEAVAVSSGGVATSGDYRNFYERGGQIYTHILDPRLGRPVETSLVSVTVIAESAARADGWATAMTVMGAEEALIVAEREGIAAYMIIRGEDGFVIQQSGAFADYLLRTGE